MQLNRKIPDASNATEYYKSFLKYLNKKFFKQSKIITQQPKTIENSYIDIKSVNTEYPKIYCKLFKTMTQAEKVSQVPK